jgi:hypothetical protein
MIRRLMLFLGLLVVPALAHAANCALVSGSSVATINTAIQAARSGACTGTANANTVALAAGSYSVTSQIVFPCTAGTQAVTLTGPTVAWPGPYTASLTGPVSGTWAFNINCSDVTITYLNWDGGRPQPGGGGAIYIAPGMNNWTISYNYLHGFQGNSSGEEVFDSAIWVDGTPTSDPNFKTQTNGLVSWNQIGNTSSIDCSNLMNAFQYNGVNYDAVGGLCGSVYTQASVTNVLYTNNRNWNIEQAYKYADGPTGGTQSAPIYYSYLLNNMVQSYNDIQNCHRNCTEAQGRGEGSVGMTFQYNDVLNSYSPGYTTMGYSLPSCCGGPSTTQPNNTFCLDNLAIGNVQSTNIVPEAFEWWSDGSCDHNLIQGYWGAGIYWGYTIDTYNWTASYNVIQLLASTIYNAKEEANTFAPIQTGNVTGRTLSQLTSAAPMISPTPTATYSSPITVTLSDAGYTGNTAGPRGNTSVYYTTDSSTPTTSSTFCGYSCTISVSPGTTVNAIGMWGAQNQPKSYPTNYGFAPSAIRSAVYPSGHVVSPVNPVVPPTNPPAPPSAPPVVPPTVPPVVPPTVPPVVPTLMSASLGATGGINTILVGQTLQFSATGVYSDGSSAAIPNASISWSSSNSAILSISSAGLATGVGADVANVMATIGVIGSSPWTVTVSPAAKMMSAHLGATGNANTLITRQTLQFSAIGVYSDGSSATVTNSGISWSSSNSAVLSISNAGLASAVGAGVANVKATISGIDSSPWTVTVSPANAAPPASNSVPTAPGAPIGDTFLGPFWQTINPTGGSTSISNGHLFIGVPGGSNHDPNSPSNQAVRMVQTIGGENFDVSIKIDSALVPTDANTSEGLMVLHKNESFMTFSLTTDGTKIGLRVQTTTAGVENTVLNDTDFSAYQNPMYLRLTRTGSAYVALYSVDGTNWLQASSFTDTDVPIQIGPFASNYNDTPANAVPVVMSVSGFDVQQ